MPFRISEEKVCELLLENRDNNIFYVKLDYRLSNYYEEDNGKLASEVYQNHHDVIRNVNNYIIEVIYPRSSKMYQDYFKDENKPFITEVWKRENGTTMKLIYYRSNENDDFIDLVKGGKK